MWFKRVLLRCCAASLAANTVTASITKDAAVLRRQHIVERLTFPSLERRQQSFGNQTSSSNIIKSEPSIASTSSVLASEKPSTNPTITSTPSIIVTTESIASLTPPPFSSESSSIAGRSSSRSSDASSAPSSLDLSVRSSSTAEPQPSETAATSVLTATQVETPSALPTTTKSAITFAISSSIDVSHFSSTVAVSPSTAESLSDQTPMTSAKAMSSSETPQILPPFSTSLSAAETSQAVSDSTSIPSSEGAISSAAIETGSSNVPVPTMSPLSTSLASPEMGSISASGSIESTSPVSSVSKTPSEQQSTALPSFLTLSVSDQKPSSAVLESTTSTALVVSTSSLQESTRALTSEQAPEPTSLPALSSSAEETASTSVPQLTSWATVSSEEGSTASPIVSSSMLFSTVRSILMTLESTASIGGTVTSVVETSQPPATPSTQETTFTLTPSAVQSSLSLTSEQSLTSTLVESKTIVNDVSSGLGISVMPSNIVSSILSSLIPTSSSSGQLLSSSLSESAPVTSDTPSTPSRSVSSITPATTTTDATSDITSNVATITNSPTFNVPTQTSPWLSVTTVPTSSAPVAVSSDLISLSSKTLSSSIATSFTVESPVEGSSSIATTPESIATVLNSSAGPSTSIGLPVVSIGTIGLSSVASQSGPSSSFVPYETALTSAAATPTNTSPNASQTSPLLTFTFLGTQLSQSEPSASATSSMQQPTSSVVPASESRAAQNQTSFTLGPAPTSASFLSSTGISNSTSGWLVSSTQILSSHGPTSISEFSLGTTSAASIPTLESSSSLNSTSSRFKISSTANPTPSGVTSFVSDATSATSLSGSLFPSSRGPNNTQTASIGSIISATVTATFSTVYVSSIKPSILDLSTVAFSLLNSVTGAVVNQTGASTSNTRSTISSSAAPGTRVPASESIHSSSKLGFGANVTWPSSTHPSWSTGTDLPDRPNNSTTSTIKSGVTFSLPALTTGVNSGTPSSSNATRAVILQTSSKEDPTKLSTTQSATPIASDNDSSLQSSTSSSESETASNTDGGAGTDSENTMTVPPIPTTTPSQTASAGTPPPLTTSQTAGVAVGGTTFILIAVVAAIFIARRYHAAKHGKRMSTGSVYPKVAYLYDPKSGGGGDDAEALMSGATGGMPPHGPVSQAARGFPRQTQRHSTGTTPVDRFTNSVLPFRGSIRDPAIHRYSESELARMDTAKALSAAVAGYAGATRHSSSYTKYPSNCSNPFSDHIIPSPTFAPFSPDDIRRPELKTPLSTNDGRGEYSQMSINPYAYLNTAASMYPPISPYGRPTTHRMSSSFPTRRQTMDSDPFADPFEHDLLLQVDERDRTSDSVTIFAPSPNLTTPRTPRTPVGPKLPVRQPNGLPSARSLLSPVAAKYMHKAQEVKIPRKSIASPVLVQVGRSPVIKPFSPPPAAPEPLGWEDIKRHSEKRFSDERSVPAPLQFVSPLVKKKPVPSSHTRTKPSLTGAGQALLAGNVPSLTVNVPKMHNRSVGLDVPRVHNRSDPAYEGESSDPVVREKRSREMRFADPALIGKKF